MNKSAVEYLAEQVQESLNIFLPGAVLDEIMINKAKEMERNERLKRQLFIGKVTEIIGFDKVVELWKECDEVFKSEQQ